MGAGEFLQHSKIKFLIALFLSVSSSLIRRSMLLLLINDVLFRQKEFIRIFITQKGLMEKNTHNVILGMGYFEFFYMQQLKEYKRSLETFIKKYPKINAATKKNVRKIYSLNKARKSMREAFKVWTFLIFDIVSKLNVVKIDFLVLDTYM